MMAFNFARRRLALHALLLSWGLLAGTSAMAQDLSVPADPVAAIEGDWNGIWEDWSVTVTNGRVVLTKGDPKTYSWLPVGTVLGVLNNNGKSEGRLFRFSGSTCLDHPRDKSPSEYQTIPCGDFGAVLTVYGSSYELRVSGISLRRSKSAAPKEQSSRKDTASKGKPPTGKALEVNKPLAENARNAAGLAAEAPAAQSKYIEVPGPNGMIRLSPEVAARNQAKADDYHRKMEEHARARAEHDQRLAQHRQNTATAASAEEEYKREVAAAAERVAAHRVAMADHARKVAVASTNDDPNTCITRPEFRSNDGFPGNTSASVINGCPQKVDIVLCLKRTTGDWTCGAKFGILTQGKMTYASRNATGEVFIDAITYGGGGKLKRPAGM